MAAARGRTERREESIFGKIRSSEEEVERGKGHRCLSILMLMQCTLLLCHYSVPVTVLVNNLLLAFDNSQTRCTSIMGVIEGGGGREA